MTAGAPEMVVLRWLAHRGEETALAVAAVYRMKPGEVCAHLGALERAKLVSSREDKNTIPTRRLYAATAEGRRRAGISGARTTG